VLQGIECLDRFLVIFDSGFSAYMSLSFFYGEKGPQLQEDRRACSVFPLIVRRIPWKRQAVPREVDGSGAIVYMRDRKEIQ